MKNTKLFQFLTRINKIYYFILLAIGISLIIFLIINERNKRIRIANLYTEELKVDTLQIDTSNYRYGIKIDSFKVIESKVKQNQVLANLVSGYQVSNSNLIEAVDSAKNILDVRKIRTGSKYVLLTKKDSIERLHYLIYELNRIEYIVFQFVDSIHVYKGIKQVDTVIKNTAGIINTSLWVDMYKIGASPLLITKLSDVYAWEIDFFRINKGDKFKLIYEETIVDGKSVGIGKIIAAEFTHNDNSHYAILFDQNDKADYYDDEGGCLRKMFLKAPLQFSRISSHFSNNRFHPVLKRYRPHHGVDYAAAYGTPVSAVGDGTIVKAGYSGGAGNMIKIRHNSVYTTAYLHLSKYGKGIKKGAKVIQGQVIGYVGSTGLSTGPHLDYRVWKNGSNVNPLTLDLPPVESVSEENMTEFNKLKDIRLKELDDINYIISSGN